MRIVLPCVVGGLLATASVLAAEQTWAGRIVDGPASSSARVHSRRCRSRIRHRAGPDAKPRISGRCDNLSHTENSYLIDNAGE
jgi:hypothetical protein